MVLRSLHLNQFNKKYFILCLSFALTIIIGISIGWQWSQTQALTIQKQISLKIIELENLVSEISRTSSLDKSKLAYQVDQLQEQLNFIASDSAVITRDQLINKIELVKEVSNKYQNYLSKGAKVATLEPEFKKIFNNLIENNDQLASQINNFDSKLDEIWKSKLIADELKQQQLSAPINNSPNIGYSRITVQTTRGNFITDIITASLSSTKIITVTGNDGNCDNNCVAKPLAQYITENSGFAGINGSYFCPPDYPSCSGKTYSYDFPVYSSIHNKWINADKLFWNDRGMAAFIGSTPRFCQTANSCDSGGISAGIINYPTLISNNNIVVNEGGLPDTLIKNKGFRGAIGVSSDKIFLAIVRGATVIDTAHVLKNLGVTHALNLDGGGSSAMYYGNYKVGPGRLLPNAIVLK